MNSLDGLEVFSAPKANVTFLVSPRDSFGPQNLLPPAANDARLCSAWVPAGGRGLSSLSVSLTPMRTVRASGLRPPWVNNGTGIKKRTSHLQLSC